MTLKHVQVVEARAKCLVIKKPFTTCVESVVWIKLILSLRAPAQTTGLLITWQSPRDEAQDLARSYTCVNAYVSVGIVHIC